MELTLEGCGLGISAGNSVKEKNRAGKQKKANWGRLEIRGLKRAFASRGQYRDITGNSNPFWVKTGDLGGL
jgi:hypothetical protein